MRRRDGGSSFVTVVDFPTSIIALKHINGNRKGSPHFNVSMIFIITFESLLGSWVKSDMPMGACCLKTEAFYGYDGKWEGQMGKLCQEIMREFLSKLKFHWNCRVLENVEIEKSSNIQNAP